MGDRCIECGEVIPQKRLAAVPGADMCVKCEERYGAKKHDARSRVVMNALVQRAEVDVFDAHAPEAHV